MNKKFTLYFLLFFGLIILNCKKDVSALQKKEALLIAENFQKDLQNTLTTSIQEAGIENSIDKCKLKSIELESQYSKKEKWHIKRISDKYRNPDHKPDAFESSVLEKWKEELKAGKALAPVVSNANGYIKVLKPIVMKNQLCLQCHGTNLDISETTSQAIQKSYPNDTAVNYKLDELRGAFSLTFKTE